MRKKTLCSAYLRYPIKLTTLHFVLYNSNFAPVCLSEDHKPGREDEAKRIRDAGGFVINGRVMGELAVSRAFGDVDFKKGLQVRRLLCVWLSVLSILRQSPDWGSYWCPCLAHNDDLVNPTFFPH